MERLANDSPDARRIRTALDQLPPMGLIDDTTARIIASRWHGGQTTELYSFTSTGRIDLEALRPEITADYLREDITKDERDELTALALYFVETGGREAMERVGGSYPVGR